MEKCPVCGNAGKHYTHCTKYNLPNEYDYYLCTQCGSIFIQPDVLNAMDLGEMLLKYDMSYWERETASAIERSYGSALARLAETMYYVQRPVEHFLDIGAGAGLLLDAISRYLPSKAGVFYGVEKYPPQQGKRVQSPNYYTNGYTAPGVKFDAGICMEVFEHLTPNMLRGLMAEVAQVSNPGALYLINTGLAEFTLKENPGYLDPFECGHVMSWTTAGVRTVCSGLGFKVFPIRGKTWAFAMEYQSTANENEDITDRIWSALPTNLELLCDKTMGSVLKILGLESVRAYL